MGVPQRKCKGLYQRQNWWWVRLPLPSGGYRREKAGATIEEAQQHQRRRLEELARLDGPSLDQAIARLFEVAPRPRSHAYHSHARYFHKRFNELRLREVAQVELLRAWREERLRERRPATVAHELAFLAQVFDRAVRDGHLSDQLVGKGPTRVNYPKVDNERTRTMLPAEEPLLRPRFTAGEWECVDASRKSGLRKSEQARLGWEDLAGGFFRLRTSKNGKGRFVPIHRDLVAMLERRKDEGLERPFPEVARLNRKFNAVAKQLGLAELTWHCLRHTCATDLHAAGVDTLRIKEILGHATEKMSARYTHVRPDHLVDAINAIGRPPSLELRISRQASGEVVTSWAGQNVA